MEPNLGRIHYFRPLRGLMLLVRAVGLVDGEDDPGGRGSSQSASRGSQGTRRLFPLDRPATSANVRANCVRKARRP